MSPNELLSVAVPSTGHLTCAGVAAALEGNRPEKGRLALRLLELTTGHALTSTRPPLTAGSADEDDLFGIMIFV